MFTKMITRSALTAAILGLSVIATASSASATVTTVTSTVAQSGFDDWTTSEFPLTGSNWTFASHDYLNIIDVTVTLTLGDGDTAIGDFDYNNLFLALDGFDTGIALNGFADGATVTGTVGPQALSANGSNILAALNADNALFGSIIDISPGDNLITVPSNFDTTLSLTVDIDNPTPEVPEPATLALFGLGLAGIGAARRQKQRKA
jgi:hypothetical protein